jgi:ATP-dependent RNA helicase DeaD
MPRSFEALGLVPEILQTIEELGYAEPTPIQELTIPLLLSGRDVIGQAQTGTGKTAAFALPSIQRLEGDGLQMLILTPTRELAIQVAEAVYRYGRHLGIRVLPVYGGESYERQERRLARGVHVVVGTPGRTLDLIRKRTLRLGDVRFVVLDEADEMLKMGFIEDVETILAATDVNTRQTLMFSATFAEPLLKLAANYMRNPQRVSVEAEEVTGDNIDQHHYVVQEKDKLPALCRLLEIEDQQNTLIFARTRAGAAELAESLAERGYAAVAIHGDLAQNERERILRRYRDGSLRILVATDVVGRGVDIPDVTHVINYDIPQLAIEYVHRIGRTGRAGRAGKAMTLLTPRQRGTLRQIEEYIQKAIPKAKLPTTEAVLERRETHFMQRLVAQITATTEADPALDSLLAMGYPPDQIAAAVLTMLRAEEKQHPLEEIDNLQETKDRRDQRDTRGANPRRDRNDRPERGERSDRPARAARPDRGTRSEQAPDRRGRRNSHESGMVRLWMDVGRSKGIRPNDVVYAVASSADIPGSAIGAIDIRQNETFLDVPEAHVDQVLKKLRQGRIRGQAMKLTRA